MLGKHNYLIPTIGDDVKTLELGPVTVLYMRSYIFCNAEQVTESANDIVPTRAPNARVLERRD